MSFAETCKNSVSRFMNDNKVLVRYIKDKKGCKRGVVVALEIEGKARVGHSLCNTKLDSFNRYVGLYIALQRALKNSSRIIPTDDGEEVVLAYVHMYARSMRYFRSKSDVNCLAPF